MTCQQVQINLSLYLYGELEFAKEEELESHLAGCSFCQMALSREKSWHASLNSEHQDVPLDLLSQCRRDLRVALGSSATTSSRPAWFSRLSWFTPPSLFTRLGHLFRSSSNRWSTRIAFASLFLFLGFSLSRWTDHFPTFSGFSLGNANLGNTNEAGLSPSFSRIRAVQGGDDNRVRIVVDQVHQQEVVGNINDAIIRELLLRGSKDPVDPGLRVDSVELLNGHDGSDIRDALLYSVTHDTNAAVRLKALEGLRRFQNDRETQDALVQVLEDDSSPAVRSETIDVLTPASSASPLSPSLADALRSIMQMQPSQSQPSDDYIRARCQQILNSGNPNGLY